MTRGNSINMITTQHFFCQFQFLFAHPPNHQSAFQKVGYISPDQTILPGFSNLAHMSFHYKIDLSRNLIFQPDPNPQKPAPLPITFENSSNFHNILAVILSQKFQHLCHYYSDSQFPLFLLFIHFGTLFTITLHILASKPNLKSIVLFVTRKYPHSTPTQELPKSEVNSFTNYKAYIPACLQTQSLETRGPQSQYETSVGLLIMSCVCSLTSH